MKNVKLYYHKTSGGAEYLSDTFLQTDWCNKCEAESPNDGNSKCDVCGSEKYREGVFENAKYVVRIDGDITKDAELIIKGNV